MSNSDYALFAPYYDELMRGAQYEARADYFCEVFRRFSHVPRLGIDLACGTGSLTLALKKRGYEFYGVDASPEMLSKAMEKCADAGEQILFLCQKLERLDLYGTVDTAVSSLDSLNHLSGRRSLQQAFLKTGFFMEKGGLFVFDLNTVYKHREVLATHTFVYETPGVFCVWQNTLSGEDCRVRIDLDFFHREGETYRREHSRFSEYAYEIEDVREMLRISGFETLGVFDDLSFEPPKKESERIVFAARKTIEAGEKTN